MALATAARYTGSAVETILGAALLGLAVLHAAAGVPSAILPAVGGLVLLGAAVALAPPLQIRWKARSWSSVGIFAGSLVIAAATIGLFVLGGRLF